MLSSVVFYDVVFFAVQNGMLPGELSDQVIDAFREMGEQQAMQVLNTFQNSNLNTINNRSAFLLGLIKQSYKGN